MPAPEIDPIKDLLANAAQAERLHGFSHGLRNKLTGLFEAMRMLQEERRDPEHEEIAAFAEIQFFQALRDVEALLDDFGVERGVGRLKKEDLDLAHVIDSGIAHSEHRLAKKEQRVERKLANGLTLNADRYYVEEAIAALVSNASKFSAPASVIHVTSAVHDGQAVITVRDNGVGLTADDLHEVFTRFAWLSSKSTAGEAQGRGTLSRVKTWVEAHGGTVTAESAGTGKGATFTLRLPLEH